MSRGDHGIAIDDRRRTNKVADAGQREKQLADRGLWKRRDRVVLAPALERSIRPVPGIARLGAVLWLGQADCHVIERTVATDVSFVAVTTVSRRFTTGRISGLGARGLNLIDAGRRGKLTRRDDACRHRHFLRGAHALGSPIRGDRRRLHAHSRLVLLWLIEFVSALSVSCTGDARTYAEQGANLVFHRSDLLDDGLAPRRRCDYCGVNIRSPSTVGMRGGSTQGDLADIGTKGYRPV